MALRPLKIPITEAPPLLRGLVQHVLSPCRYSGAINQLECLQALRDKTLYDKRQPSFVARAPLIIKRFFDLPMKTPLLATARNQ
jgi:hypothetical protein